MLRKKDQDMQGTHHQTERLVPLELDEHAGKLVVLAHGFALVVQPARGEGLEQVRDALSLHADLAGQDVVPHIHGTRQQLAVVHGGVQQGWKDAAELPHVHNNHLVAPLELLATAAVHGQQVVFHLLLLEIVGVVWQAYHHVLLGLDEALEGFLLLRKSASIPMLLSASFCINAWVRHA